MNDLTYFESVNVSWFIYWRIYLFSVVLGLITAWAEIRMDEPFQRIIMALGVFVILPIFLRLALRKHYDGFRFQVAREAH